LLVKLSIAYQGECSVIWVERKRLSAYCIASPHFDRVIYNVGLLLSVGWVHADLSAYNILYHDGKPILIDSPQVVSTEDNPSARSIFERDVARVVAYFARFDVRIESHRLAHALWSKHVPRTRSHQ
jgi:serine/threonine-protein kinase RIO1